MNHQSASRRRSPVESLALLIESAEDVVFVYRLDPPGFDFVSPSITQLVGGTPDEHYADPLLGLTLAHPDDRPALEAAFRDPVRHPLVQVRLVARDGRVIRSEFRTTVALDEAGHPQAIIGMIRDISASGSTESRLARLAGFYAALREANHVIARCRSQEELFPELCRIAVEHLSLIGAWIGIVDPATRAVVPHAAHGIGGAYVARIRLSCDPTVAEGQGPTGMAIRDGRPHVVADIEKDARMGPWLALALEAGVRSSAAIPLGHPGSSFGVLNLYAAEPGFFDAELVSLLQELARDIAFGLGNFERDARQREAEERLRASETKFRVLFESARDAIFLLDDNRIVECNPGTVELFGHARDAIIGRSPVAFSPTLQPDGERSADKAARVIQAARNGVPQRFEWRHTHGDRREYDTEVTLNRVELDGRVLVQVIVHDITNRKLVEARTTREALRYRNLMQAALDGIHILDGDGNLLEANDRFYELLGYDPVQPPHLNVIDWDAQSGREGLLTEISHDLKSARVFETMYRRADGTTVPVEVSAIGVDLGDEHVLYCAARDISARKCAEEERVALQRSLLQAQKMESVGRLAGGVAHDFNNLLTVISGYASLLEADAERHPAMAAKAAEIVRATNRASELTRKLLIFSRRHPDEPRVIAPDDFLRQEARMVPRLIGEHIAVVASPGAPDTRVRIDPAQLAQVLMNLVVNARDAMPEGGTLTLRTRLLTLDDDEAARQPGARSGEYVCLSVMDTGTGMTPDVQAHLFEPFFTTKEVGRGTGLGLATAYGIIKQAGGFIDVWSEAGRGTSMNVMLPTTECAHVDDVAEKPARIVGGRERVLVVEDEATVRELTRTCLERLGYTVLAAGSPVEALAIVRAGATFDLVVSDVVMPGMNGHRLVQELRAMRVGFEVLFVSGFADTGVAGTTDVTIDPARFLAKPFSPAALGHRVRDLLDQRLRGTAQP